MFNKTQNDKVLGFSSRFIKYLDKNNISDLSKSEIYDKLIEYSEKTKYKENYVFLSDVFNKSTNKLNKKFPYKEIEYFAIPEMVVFSSSFNEVNNFIEKSKNRTENIKYFYELNEPKKKESKKRISANGIISTANTAVSRARNIINNLGSKLTYTVSVSVKAKKYKYNLVIESITYTESISFIK